jgi:hypothetical protein
VPDYPPGLDAIVLKGLARDPEQRFASAKELELALESFAREHGMLPSSAGIGVLLLDTFGPPAPVWDVERLESVSKGGPVTDSGTWAIPPSPAFGVLAGPEGAMASSPVPRPVRSSRAPDTRSRAGKSGKFVVPTDEDASASQSGLDSWTSSASSEIDAEYTPSVSTHGTRLTPAREDVPSNSGRLWWTLAIVGAVGGAAAFAFASRGSDDSPAVAASVPTSAVDAEPAAEVSQAALDTAQMLQLVNRTDFDSALELSERQRVLAILRKDPDYANAIDERLQRSLDLVQASQSPTPCLAFRDALEAIRAQPDASYRPALERARVPSAATGAVEAGTAPDKSCRGLQESLDALRVAVGDARTPAAPVAPVAEPEVPAEPPPKPTRSRRRHAKHDSSHSRSSPPPSEPQDEPETRPETPSEPPPAPVRRMEKLRDGELRPLGK